MANDKPIPWWGSASSNEYIPADADEDVKLYHHNNITSKSKFSYKTRKQ